ncbi:MAG TPA: hypothetical protein VHO48_13480 [Anaerolineaceae bacterium]|nr:hypothetical protein [Anaerolineaceae bacterium]
MAAELAIHLSERKPRLLLVAGFGFARLLMLLGLSSEALRGYGDFQTFFWLSELPGWPYMHSWAEFPPLFPWLSEALFRLSAGRQPVYELLLAFILSLADAGSLWIFSRLAARLYGPSQAWLRSGLYLLVLLALPYSLWYFDPLAVFCFLAALLALVEGRAGRGGLLAGLGALFKLFPLLALVATWRERSIKKAIRAVALAAGSVLVVYLALYLISPAFTAASLRSQAGKGSWETVWALIDGNFQTGNFGSIAERVDPAAAGVLRRNPARIPPLVTLPIFGGLGLWALLRSKGKSGIASLAMVGLAWCLLLLWSPGYSVQWVLYLIPLLLLVFPLRLGALLTGAFALVNLMEWPVLLSRGRFDLLALPILLRTLLFVLAAIEFYQQAQVETFERQEITVSGRSAV